MQEVPCDEKKDAKEDHYNLKWQNGFLNFWQLSVERRFKSCGARRLQVIEARLEPKDEAGKATILQVSEALKEPKDERAEQLFSLYDEGYRFPKWSLGVHLETGRFRTTLYVIGCRRVLYEAIQLFAQREPVNVEMERFYDVAKLADLYRNLFDDEAQDGHSAYKFANGHLSPNIGVYCFTPIRVAGRQKMIHVYNAIGLALDAYDQPDFQWLKAKGPLRTQESKRQDQRGRRRAQAVEGFYFAVFVKMIYCAIERKLTRIVLPLIGLGHFAEGYSELVPRGPSLFAIWKKALRTAMDEFDEEGLQFYLMGIESPQSVRRIDREWTFTDAVVTDLGEVDAKRIGGYPVEACGFVPDIAFDPFFSEKETLFVNAADPHSVFGNENQMTSVDGAYGMHTALAVQGTPFVNRIARVVRLKLRRPGSASKVA